MSRCEICGDKEKNLTEVKISGAKMEVCSDCSDMGTKLNKPEDNETNTKYSTNKNTNKNAENSTNKNTNTKVEKGSSNKKEKDPFEDMNELALDYGQIIRDSRNQKGLDRSELAQELGIKESHLENIENERTQPSVNIQKKIEKYLDIDLDMEDDINV